MMTGNAAPRYLAIDVGGSSIKHALIDDALTLTERGSVPTAPISSSAQFIDTLAAIAEAAPPDIGGIALSLAGELDPSSGHMLSGGALRYNAGTNVRDLLAERTGLRVTVENDANCALLAERHDGALAEATNGVVLVIGTGIGGAIMINRHLYRGSNFHAGNASNVLRTVDGPYAIDKHMAPPNSAAGLIAGIAAATGRDPGALDGRSALDLVAAGDPGATRFFVRFCQQLAWFIFNTQALLDVDVVAIGGGVSAHPVFLASLAPQVDQIFATSAIQLPGPRLTACRYGNDANLIGALHFHLGRD